MTTKREESSISRDSQPATGVTSYTAALSALVPAEALTAHAVIISLTTKIKTPDKTVQSTNADTPDQTKEPATTEDPAAGNSAKNGAAITNASTTAANTPSSMAVYRAKQSSTQITEPKTLQWAFFGLIALCIVLYVLTRSKDWNKWDYGRVLIPPSAFVGWTMLQRTTAFDAVAPHMQEAPRTVAAVFIAIVLGLAATLLSYSIAPPKPGKPA